MGLQPQVAFVDEPVELQAEVIHGRFARVQGAFAFIAQPFQGAIERTKRRAERICVCLDQPAQFAKLLLPQVGAVHLAGAVHQIVRFIDQEDIAALFFEEPPEIDGWVKDIIIVADDQ